MTVSVFMCSTLSNSNTTSPIEFSDALNGGGTGINLGQVSNGLYAPVTDQANNLGAQDIYISHDSSVDPITDCKIFIGSYSQTYGGSNSANADIANIIAEGQTSSSGVNDKNNANGTSSGVWMDFSYNVSSSNQFDIATRPGAVKIFGDNGTDGIDLNSAFDIPTTAIFYASDASTEAAPSSAENGKIGVSSGSGFAGDSALGNRAKVKTRIYLRSTFAAGGVFQFDYIFRYSFTA